MFKFRILTIALAGTALAAAPAQAGGLLGGAGDCLCQAVGGLIGGGAPGGGLLGNGSVVGNVTGSISNGVNGALSVDKSFDRRNGSASANAGLAGTVHSVANAAVGAEGLGKSIGLAGSSTTDGAISKQVGLAVQGVGTDHARGPAGSVSGTANAAVNQTLAVTREHGTGSGSGSVNGTLNGTVNKTLAVTKGHGAGSGGGSASGTLNGAVNKTLAVTKGHGAGSGGGSANGALNGTVNKTLAVTKGSGGGSATGSLDGAVNKTLAVTKASSSRSDAKASGKPPTSASSKRADASASSKQASRKGQGGRYPHEQGYWTNNQ